MQWAMSDAPADEQFVKCLIYGKSGVGKTVLTATAPAPILISAESGTLSLRKKNLERLFGVNTPGITYNIPMILVTDMKSLNEAYAWVANAADAKPFRTVCLDSITEIAEVVLANAKLGVKDPRQAYGELISQMLTLIKAFRDLRSKHVAMFAKEEPHKDDLTGMIRHMPAMPGAKLGPSMPYYFDEVWRLGVNTDPKTQSSYRFLQTQPDQQYDAKDRSGVLAPIISPHLGAAFNAILGD